MSTVTTRDGAFAAHSGGMASSIAHSIGDRRPLLAAVIVWVLAFFVLGAVTIGLGLLVTRVLLPAGLDTKDGTWVHWFVGERTASLTAASRFGSDLGTAAVILTVSAVSGIALALARLWRQFTFLLVAMTLESGVFLLTTAVVDRHRPTVPQLDGALPTSSFPSGHMASALTLYVGLAIVVGSLIRSRLPRALVWLAAILLPVIVGASRLYRGMHFPSDIAASVVLATGAILFALLAVRSMAAAEGEYGAPGDADGDPHAEPEP